MNKLFTTACTALGIDPDTVNVELSFVGPDEIRELNKTHRGIDKPTDVLAFPMLEITPKIIPTHEAYSLDINPETNKLELGWVVVCRECADLPIDFLCVHGFLHLLGYDHDTRGRKAEMWRLTETILLRQKGESQRE